MGSLVVPGPKAGAKGEPLATPVHREPSFAKWFVTFLRDELSPYPGRVVLVARIVVAATLTMLAIMIFGLPGAAIGGYYTLLLPRESPLNTARAALTLLTCFTLSLTYTLLSAMLFVNYPLTHFLWVIGSFFLSFYAISVVTNYAAGSAFAVLIVLAVPIWDTPAPALALVAANLWTAGSVALAALMTVAVEYAFALFITTDELQMGLDDRLSAVEQYLRQVGQDDVEPKLERRLQQLAMVGVSRLRRLARSASASPDESARRSATVSLTGRLVDLASSLPQVQHPGLQRRERHTAIADRLRDLLSKTGTHRQPAAMPDSRSEQADDPILFEMERTVDSLDLSLARTSAMLSPLDQALPEDPPLFAKDAFSNRDHLHFALRGCMAASLCYIILNAVAWPGLSTSLLTCTITALTSIGSSRQKQLLRVSGAIVGGFVLGMGSQILILPMLDSIAGFTVLFVLVTAFAAWFSTASPRISYFGSQVGLAFYLIQLRGPSPQTNLAIARDNLMGILLGLTMMWFTFDMLGSKPAVQIMSELFASNLQLMATLAQPWADGRAADLSRIRALRDKIGQNFAAVNAQADAVLFEVGFARTRSLAVRERLLAWQPRLRSMFLLEIALLQYRAHISPRELHPAIVDAQRRLDAEMSALFTAMSQRLVRGRAQHEEAPLREAYARLKDAVDEVYTGQPTPRAQAVLTLSSHLIEFAHLLARDMHLTGAE